METTNFFRKILSTVFTAAVVVMSLSGNPAEAARSGAASILPLTSSESTVLSYMREEEKLAHDVYLNMFSLWGAVTFSSISESEQQHTDTMKKMIDKYNLADPALPSIGLFTNADLQGKYDQLMIKGSQSFVDGLYVGATIEEIDMIDIQHAIDVTTHLDIINAYQNLLEGSKSHLRAYVKGLAFQGITYTPQFISQELYDAIIGI